MIDTTTPGAAGNGATNSIDETRLGSDHEESGDHGLLIRDGPSTFLILLIVAVLVSTFFLTSHYFGYSLRIADPEVYEPTDYGANQGGIKRRVAVLSLGAFSFLLMFRQRRFPLWRGNPLTWTILAYIGFAALSVLWADDSSLVIRRVFSFLIISFSALAVSLTVPLRKLPVVLLLSTLAFLGFSVLSELQFGTFLHSMTGTYRFSGTCHPESQGLNCAMLILSSFVVAKTSHGLGLLACRFTILFGLIFLLLTRSRGPVVATIIALIIFRLYTSERKRNISLIYILIFILALLFLFFGQFSLDYFGTGFLMGRSEEEAFDLNGRIPLWFESVEYISKRPVFGYGFQGFWTPNRIDDISNSQGWFLNSSHSIYIETTLNLGLLGLALFMSMVATGLITARDSFLFEGRVEMVFGVCLLTLTLVDGILSSSIGGVSYLAFFLLVLLFSIARESSVEGGYG